MTSKAKSGLIEVSVVLPCQNEEVALGECIKQIKEVFKENNIRGEIIVSDSSTDKSPDIAKKSGVVLVKHNKEGYGNAYLEGFKHINGKYIFCADPDATYDFEEIPRFIREAQNDNVFVIGDRFKGRMDKGAMPLIHKYLGNPLLSFLIRKKFGGGVHDAHCGMRALTKNALKKLDLKTTGMELASEMIVKALENEMKIIELPIDYHKRKGESKLRTFPDGWRHLKYILSTSKKRV